MARRTSTAPIARCKNANGPSASRTIGYGVTVPCRNRFGHQDDYDCYADVAMVEAATGATEAIGALMSRTRRRARDEALAEENARASINVAGAGRLEGNEA